MNWNDKPFRLLVSISLFLVFFLLTLGTAPAAPNINSTSGNFIDGSIVTINGSGFGANGPTIVVFDDFESGTAGSNIRIGPNSATVGHWDELEWSPGKYDNTYKLSGSKSMKTDFGPSWLSGVQTLIPGGATDVFLSYWFYMPVGNNFPGYGDPNGLNWKTSWLWGSGPDNNDSIFMQGFGYGSGGWIAADCNNCVSCATWLDPSNGWTDFFFNTGNWYRMWVWMHGTADATSHFDVWTLKLNTYPVTKHIGKDCQQFHNVGDKYIDWCLGCYGRQTPNSQPRFDDAYLAVGPYARARVEIGNNPSYNSCTNLTILTPTSWTSSLLTATVRQGAFPNGNAYLFVTDSAGVTSPGYSIIIGPSDVPSAPQRLRIVPE